MSNPGRIELQPAYVLHRHPYRDTSLIVELLTAEHGRLGLLAKGAKRPRSPLRPLLQPFSPLLVSWVGRGELPVVIAAERGAALTPLPGEALLCGFYLNELVLRLTHRHESHRALFAHYGATLGALRASKDFERVLRRFEKSLLEEIGYGLVLEHEAASQAPIEPHRRYRYDPERGPVDVTDAADARHTLTGRSLIALREDTLWDPTTGREIKRLMRQVLEHHLGERPLASRELFRPPTPATDSNAVPADETS